MNGDILTLLDFKKFYDFAVQQSADLCVGIKELLTPFSFGNVFFKGNFVTEIQEKPDIKMNILSGIYCFRPEGP